MRVAIFIDGAYLLNRLMEAKIEPDYARLADYLLSPLRRNGPLDLLRCYFYDCPPWMSAHPSESEERRWKAHERFMTELEDLDRWQVRLGKLERRREEGREFFAQKRVDVQLAVDLVRHAAAGHIQHAVIIAGDSDFIPAVVAAKDSGATVTIWCASDRTPHRELLIKADEVQYFDWKMFPKKPSAPKPSRSRPQPAAVFEGKPNVVPSRDELEADFALEREPQKAEGSAASPQAPTATEAPARRRKRRSRAKPQADLGPSLALGEQDEGSARIKESEPVPASRPKARAAEEAAKPPQAKLAATGVGSHAGEHGEGGRSRSTPSSARGGRSAPSETAGEGAAPREGGGDRSGRSSTSVAAAPRGTPRDGSTRGSRGAPAAGTSENVTARDGSGRGGRGAPSVGTSENTAVRDGSGRGGRSAPSAGASESAAERDGGGRGGRGRGGRGGRSAPSAGASENAAERDGGGRGGRGAPSAGTSESAVGRDGGGRGAAPSTGALREDGGRAGRAAAHSASASHPVQRASGTPGGRGSHADSSTLSVPSRSAVEARDSLADVDVLPSAPAAKRADHLRSQTPQDEPNSSESDAASSEQAQAGELKTVKKRRRRGGRGRRKKQGAAPSE